MNDEESNEVKQADVGAPRISRKEMMREFSVALCRNEQRILFRLQHVSYSTFIFFNLNGLCLFSRFELEYSLYVARTHYVLDSSK